MKTIPLLLTALLAGPLTAQLFWLISDYGYGDAHWSWGSDNARLRFDHGREPDDPPLTDVIVQGNILHNSGPPRYRYAVIVEGEPNAPRGLHFTGNATNVAISL